MGQGNSMNTLTGGKAYFPCANADEVRDDWMRLVRTLKAHGKTLAVDPSDRRGLVSLEQCMARARFWHHVYVANLAAEAQS